MDLRVLFPGVIWSGSLGAAGFLRAGCRRLVVLPLGATVPSTSGGAPAFEAGASEARALIAVNPGMMIEMIVGAHAMIVSRRASCYVTRQCGREQRVDAYRRRQISGGAFVLNASCWYETQYLSVMV